MLWGLLPSEGTLEGGWPSPILPSAPGCHLPPKVLGTGLGASGRGRAPQGPVPRLSGCGIYRPTEGRNKDAIVDQGRIQSPCGSEEGRGGEGRVEERCLHINFGTAGRRRASLGKLLCGPKSMAADDYSASEISGGRARGPLPLVLQSRVG